MEIPHPHRFVDPRWLSKREEILERDSHKCRFCGHNDKNLHIHNIFYPPFVLSPWELNNGCFITICEDCHFRPRDRCCDIPSPDEWYLGGNNGMTKEEIQNRIGGILNNLLSFFK